MTFYGGMPLTLEELREYVRQDKCFWIVFQSYDPSDYQYEGPANLSPIDDEGAEGDAFYLNEARCCIPVHQTSFSMGDFYFSEMEGEYAKVEWDEGEFEIYELKGTED